MTLLKVVGAWLAAVACLIPYLAAAESYDRHLASPAVQGRILSVQGTTVRYEYESPGAALAWDPDGDGWIGPHVSDDVPASVRDGLVPGAYVVVRSGLLESTLAPPSQLLLLGFFVCLLLGFAWWFGPGLERRRLRQLGDDPVRMIEYMLRKTRRRHLVLAALGAGVGAGFFAVVWSQRADAGVGALALIGSLGGFCLLGAAFAAAGAWSLRSVSGAPIMHAILRAPERIVWVYERIVRVNGIDTHSVFLGLDDGDSFDFVAGEEAPNGLMNALAARIPHAIFGYSESVAHQWSKAPQSLLPTSEPAYR